MIYDIQFTYAFALPGGARTDFLHLHMGKMFMGAIIQSIKSSV